MRCKLSVQLVKDAVRFDLGIECLLHSIAFSAVVEQWAVQRLHVNDLNTVVRDAVELYFIVHGTRNECPKGKIRYRKVF